MSDISGFRLRLHSYLSRLSALILIIWGVKVTVTGLILLYIVPSPDHLPVLRELLGDDMMLSMLHQILLVYTLSGIAMGIIGLSLFGYKHLIRSGPI